MSTGDARAPGRPVDPSLRPAIADAVLDVLIERGYAGLTTAVVARRAGVSTATIYRRWSSKRELLLAAAERLTGDAADHLDTGSVEGDVRAILEQKQRIFAGRARQALLILCGEAAHDAELAALLRSTVLEPTHAHFQDVVDRAHARGEVGPAVDPSAAARLVLGSVLADAAFGPLPARGDQAGGDLDLLVHAVISPGRR